MTSTDSSVSERPGISPLALVVAMLVTAVVVGSTVWLSMRPPRLAESQETASPAAATVGTVTLTPEAQRNGGIQIVTADTRRVPSTIDVTGSVTAPDTSVAHVRPLARGLIEQVSVRLGERVRKGQALATYDNIQLGELVGEYLGARAVLRQSESDLEVKRKVVERGRALIRLEAIAQQTLELREAELRSAEAAVARDQASASRIEEQLHRFGLDDDDIRQLSPTDGSSPHRVASHAVLRAPFDGVITKYDVAIGEVAEPERELFTVTDLSTVWVLADIYEKDIIKVGAGGEALVRADAFPDRAFIGKVDYITDLIDPATRTAKARVVVANPDSALKLDMFARVRMPTSENRQAVLVPSAAIQTVDGQPMVFVPKDETHFTRVNVEVGTTAGEFTELRSGLAGGERVVAAGSFYLKTALLRERIGGE